MIVDSCHGRLSAYWGADNFESDKIRYCSGAEAMSVAGSGPMQNRATVYS